MTTFIELAVGQELAIGPDVVLKLLPPTSLGKGFVSEPRIGIAAPASIRIRRGELAPDWRRTPRGGGA